MKHTPHTPAVTSLPDSPRTDGDRRVRQYVITMSIRVLCFALMVLVMPHGWWTWVFALGAIVLPYIAVVIANAASGSAQRTVETPTLKLEAAAPVATENAKSPDVLTVFETREIERKDDAE